MNKKTWNDQNKKLLDDFLLAYIKRDNDMRQEEDKEAQEFIDKNKLSIWIITDKRWSKFLSIYKKHNLIYQQPM